MRSVARRAATALLATSPLLACGSSGGSNDGTGDGAPLADVGAPDAHVADGTYALPDGGLDATTDAPIAVLDALHDAAPPPDADLPAGDADQPTGDAEVTCTPGLPAGCADRTPAWVCHADGHGVDRETCPAGAACRAGECVSDCLVEGKTPAYIGCAYWSVDLDNYPDPFGDPSAVPHAVVVTNPSSAEATVTVTTLADVVLPADHFTVPPGGATVYTFPRLDVDGSGITNHSFKLDSSWPVAAYQFNPLNNVGVASDDGTVLLPDEALGREYYAFTWPTSPINLPHLPPQHGYFTVVATRPGTTTVSVTVTAPVEVGANGDVPALMTGESHDFILEQFQVLNIEADGSNLFSPNMDLTGSHILASQPVAAFGGHEEASVVSGCCAEHLEHQLYPVATWGTRYLAAHSEPRGGSTDVWRVIAAQDGTQISTIPAQPDAGMFTLDAGQWRELSAADSFEIVGSGPISVAQYLASGESTPDGIGDPSLIMAVPVEQFRTSYIVLTPADYNEDYLSVIRPVGGNVFLDAEALPSGPGSPFSPIGNGDFELAWIPVADGPHTLIGDQPFGLIAQGWSQAVSYGYAAGLDLKAIGPRL